MVGHEIWRETLKNVQNEKKNTLWEPEYGKKQRKTSNMRNTLQDLDCGKKTEKRGK